MILLYALLELAKEYAEPCITLSAVSATPPARFPTSSIIPRPEGIREARHLEGIIERWWDDSYRRSVVDDVHRLRASAMLLHLTSDWNRAWDVGFGIQEELPSCLSALLPVSSERRGCTRGEGLGI